MTEPQIKSKGTLFGAGTEFHVKLFCVTAFAGALYCVIMCVVCVCTGSVFFAAQYALVATIDVCFLWYVIKSEKLRRELMAAKVETEGLAKFKSDLFSRMSHEMRTPLSVISLYARLAARQIRRGTVSDQTITDLKTISGEAERLADMADGTLKILTSSFGASGAGGLCLAPVDIGALVQKVIDLMKYASAVIVKDPAEGSGEAWHKNAVKDIDVNIGMDTAMYVMDISPGKKPVPNLYLYVEQGVGAVLGDEDVLIQLFWNMLSNAISLSTVNNVSIRVRTANDDFVEITVEDDGHGIPADLLPRVFDKGVSGTGGSGIGLSICKDIVKWHDGRIRIDSEEGKGTVVTVMLRKVEK